MIDLVNLKDKVEYCLKHYPETRNSDIRLTIFIWENYYPTYISEDNKVSLKSLYDLPREDNIKRIRAKFQNELGLYLPTNWEVAKKRRINEETWKEYIRKFNANHLQPSFL